MSTSTTEEKNRQSTQSSSRGFTHTATADNYSVRIRQDGSNTVIGCNDGQPYMLNPPGNLSWSREDRRLYVERIAGKMRSDLEKVEMYLRQTSATTYEKLLVDEPSLAINTRERTGSGGTSEQQQQADRTQSAGRGGEIGNR